MSFFRVNPPEFTIEDMMQVENQISINHDDEDDIRRGLSACESREELASYLAQSGIEFRDDWTLVEFEGTYAEEDDVDADRGAVLAYAERVIATEVIGEVFVYEILDAHEELFG